MPDPQQPLASWLQQARKNWAILTQSAVLLLGVIGAFLLPPPVGVSERDDKVWLRLAQFTIAVSVGLLIVPARRWGRKKDVPKWWLISLLFFALSIAAFFEYQNLTYKHTCSYFGKIVVIGTTHTQIGDRYVNKNPGITCQQLLIDSAGGVDKVWTKDSIDRNRLLLAATYISCLPLFTICIIGLIQALNSIATKS